MEFPVSYLYSFEVLFILDRFASGSMHKAKSKGDRGEIAS